MLFIIFLLIVHVKQGLEEMVGAMGFEPMTPASRTLCADQTAPRPDLMVHYKG
jgi:hypothetical protein